MPDARSSRPWRLAAAKVRASRLMLAVMMSGIAVSSGCTQHGALPPSLNQSLSRTTDAGLYTIKISPLMVPMRVNQIHSWRVELRDATGGAVQNAAVEVSGGMPQHGHGFPTRPRVIPQAEAGRYALEGMKFNMTGWWEIRLDVQSPLGLDHVTFNTVLPAATPS